MKRNLTIFLVVLVAVLATYLLAKPIIKKIKLLSAEVKPAPVVILPELMPACACESSYEGKSSGTPQHFEKDGVTVRWGRVNKYDRGICQINVKIHGVELKKMGLDVEKKDDNITFANHLFLSQGLKPWSWSYDPIKKKCQWEK